MQSLRTKTIGTDLLFYHLKYQHTEEILRMLQNREVTPNDQDINGMTSLHVVTELENANLVRILLNYGANPNTPTHLDVGYYLPIHKACEKGNREIVEMLIRAGSDLNFRNKLGHTALHVAVRQRNVEITRMLISQGADPNIRDVMGCNPSYYAKINDVKELIAELPPPITMKPEEVMEHRIFVRAVLGFDPDKKSDKKGKKGKGKKGKGKKGKKK
ncbi:unnamed protein product [Blepharisma stoltei]|uniref:Ankyrin repeat protein n=1 Tax=Blepharisma stoltei TaxID=1481888 RepID=A0AAU9IE89_9CILI|nr:unnamed protein product [Blepharisma stoltei]